MTRRTFVSTTAAALAVPQALSASDPIRVGIIGVGNIGTRHLERRLLPMERQDGILKMTAACDIYDRAKFRAQEMIGLSKKDVHHDFRELLARPDVDAVLIATPEHWHAPMALAAVEAGKDVYLEKPMTRTVAEAKQLTEAVERTGRVLQVGSQWVSDPAYHEAKRLIGEGLIGDVVWMQSSYSSNHPDGVWQYYVDEEANPETVDWKAFLGEAPDQEFSGERFFRWRKYWDFSGGIATDFLYHRLSPLLYAVGPRFPTRVTASGGLWHFQNRQVPDSYQTTIEYDSFGCDLFGSCASQSSNSLHGPTIYGRKATIEIGTGQVVVKPERLFADEFKKATGKDQLVIEVDNRDQQTARTAHMLNFLECVRTREKPIFDARFGYQVMAAIKLGVDSYRQGRVFGFDSEYETILDPPPERPHGYEGDGKNDPDAGPQYGKRGVV
ncbi:MAG: Gfo/Idh/MocA family oxidoreductase [Bryobacterales bacterium]|nr:Gfo/Idh/MocA family oxidoreductase [Acidobacteriota bacterium]MCB9384174.1 Gfo/Idh/MocA family oxidoreductase [Bryobacterales bacterium]